MVKPCLYVYKGIVYEESPFRNFNVDKVEEKEGILYKTVSRRIPIFIRLFILFILLLPSICINYFISTNTIDSVHRISVPSEMYYDKENNIIDIDVSNDVSNLEDVSIEMVDSDGNPIFRFKNIEPGQSVGSVNAILHYERYPIMCTLKYIMSANGKVLDTIYLDVLLVDRDIADRDHNLDF